MLEDTNHRAIGNVKFQPSFSVVIRSYNRLDACIELLTAVLAQEYPCFEVVVVEQSTVATAEQQARFHALVASARPKVRVVRHPPLGAAQARNVGWQEARHDVVLFIDDDDLPVGTSWIAAHARNFADPAVAGVSGRDIYAPDDTFRYRFRWWARHRCLRYSFLGYPFSFCRYDGRIERVDWLHGGNGSVRRSIVEAVGGWDGSMHDHEEHSFAFRLRLKFGRLQRLVFDPEAVMLRRTNLPGGAGRRQSTTREVYLRTFAYYHRVVATYRPRRFRALYPVYLLLPLRFTLDWLWRDGHRYPRLRDKLRAGAGSLLVWPKWYLEALQTARRQRDDDSTVKTR